MHYHKLQNSLSDNDKLRFEVIDGVVSIKINTWYRVVWYMDTDVSGGSVISYILRRCQ